MSWTPDRPTKPGKYWLARRGDAVRVVEITPGGFVWDVPVTSWEEEIEADYFAGALWRPYVEPADPHSSPQPSLRSRIEALPDLVLGSGRVIGGAVDRGAVLALLDEVTR